MTVAESTRLTRRIRRRAAESGVRMASVGVYGTDIGDPGNAEMWDSILEIVRSHPEILRAYAFSCEEEEKTASFIVALKPESRDERNSVASLERDLEKAFPGVAFDIDSILDF